MPLLERLPMRAHGLDFGSGPGATLSVLLEERGGFWSRRLNLPQGGIGKTSCVFRRDESASSRDWLICLVDVDLL
jgi:hypothetical protein